MSKIIIASGPVIVENNRVLLNQHGDTNFWKFCGGKVNDFESDLIENAKREAKEEMGIDIEVVDSDPFIMYLKKDTPEGEADVILVHFLAKRIGDVKPNKDIRQWDWIGLDTLPSDLAPNIEPTLKHFGFLT